MGIYTESKEGTQPPFFCLSKKTRSGKECAAFGCILIHSTISKAQLLGYILFNLPHCPQRLIAGAT